MKKILKMTAFLLIFASLFAVVSCGTTTTIENSGSDTSSSTLIPNENTNTQNNTNNNNNSTDGNKETLGNILINLHI